MKEMRQNEKVREKKDYSLKGLSSFLFYGNYDKPKIQYVEKNNGILATE